MNKLYMIGATAAASIVFAIAAASPVSAAYSNVQVSGSSRISGSDDKSEKAKADENDKDKQKECEKEDSHGKDGSGKNGSKESCAKTAKATTASAVSNELKPTELPNTGPGSIILAGILAALAGYGATLLRLKYRSNQ